MIKIKFTIDFIPTTANKKTNNDRTNRYYANAIKKSEERAIAWQIRSQFKELPHFENLVYQDVIFYCTYKNDWDNLISAIKPINDVLVKLEIIKNDNLVNIQPDLIKFVKSQKKDFKIEIKLKEKI